MCEPELILPRQATDKHTYGKPPEFGLPASAVMIMKDGRMEGYYSPLRPHVCGASCGKVHYTIASLDSIQSAL